MLEEYHLYGMQTTREETFYTTTYDPIIPISMVIQRFQGELAYCEHLCPDEEIRIGILARRLGPDVLRHLPSTEIMTLGAFVRAVTSYDGQRRRSATILVPRRDGKHKRLDTPPPQSISSGPTQIGPSQLPQGGQQWPGFGRSYQEQPSVICPGC